MSNWGTMVQRVVQDSHSLIMAADAKRRIVDAMRFHRDKRFWWSERTFEFQLTPNVAIYKPGDGNGLPADVQEVASKMLRLRVAGSTSADYCISRATSDEMDHYKATDSLPGDPIAWDWYAGSLELWPTPTLAYVVEGRYLRSVEIPKVTYASGSYSFTLPSTGAAVADDWESDWLDQDGMGNLIYWRAMYLVQTYLQDQEAAAMAQTTWLEHLGQAEDETDQRTAGMTLRLTPRY